MYKKLSKIFIGNNVTKFILIIFCIALSLTGFLVSDNLVGNIQRIIGEEAKPILGGDIKLEARGKMTEEQLTYLENLEDSGLIEISEKVQTFSTIVDKYGEPDLASLIFVEENYPLYGDFIVDKKEGQFLHSTDSEELLLNSKEAKGQYYASQSVIDIFEQNGELEVFGRKYRTAGVIEKFPESSVNFYDEGKKVVLPLSEFYALKIEQLGSRIEKEYLIKVINPKDFETLLLDFDENPLFERVRVRDYKSGGETFQDIFAELDRFIKYVLIVSFLLTILIIFLSVESFYIGNKKSFAILKILGLGDTKIVSFNILLFSMIFAISYLGAVVMSYLAFEYIRTFDLASDFYIIGASLIETAILGIIIVAISVIIPLLKFFSNNPLAGLKENFLQVYTKKEIGIQTLLVALGLVAIYTLSIGSFISALIFTTIFLIGIFLIVGLYFYILKFIFRRFSFLRQKNFGLYDAMRNTIKPGNLSLLISFGFIISFTSLLFISTLSLNFLEKLNIDLSNNNNVYIINIPDEDIEKIDEQYTKNAFSIILARVTRINATSLKEHLGERGESGRFTREFNITDSSLSDVKILDGKVISPGEVSIDEDFSKSLRVVLGDEIEFLIYGKKKLLTITNIRKSNSGTSFEPFFFFQVHPEDFKNFPKNYFMATYIEPARMKDFKTDILEKTGSYVSFIEIEEILTEIKSISKKALTVIQVLFSYIFFFCIASLVVSIIFLLPFKKKKAKLYHILGASQKFIGNNNISEYLYLQVLALLLSIIIATGAAYYALSFSDFIIFSWPIYFQALGIIGFISIAIFGLIYVLTRRVSQ